MSPAALPRDDGEQPSDDHADPRRVPVVLGVALVVAWTALAAGGAFLAAILTQFCAFAECSQPNVVLGSTVATAVALLWAAGVLGVAHLSGLLPSRFLAPAVTAGGGLALLFGSLFAAAGQSGNGTNYYPRAGDLPEDQLIHLSEQLAFGMRAAAVALLIIALVMVGRRVAVRA